MRLFQLNQGNSDPIAVRAIHRLPPEICSRFPAPWRRWWACAV